SLAPQKRGRRPDFGNRYKSLLYIDDFLRVFHGLTCGTLHRISLVLRCFALNRLRADTFHSISPPGKLKTAAYNPDYLATALQLRKI
ncbi:MAG: hypothetical protein LBF50_08345, partial [Azoarcus sp.]|nr:hypothetical protein [Azoarcus sp.]